MLSVKQGGIKYHFLNLLTWTWTPVSRPIGEYSNHYANVQLVLLLFFYENGFGFK